MNSEKKTKKRGLLKLLFGSRKELSIYEEEALESQFRVVARRFLSKKLNIAAVILFAGIFLLMVIYPVFRPLDVNYQETTQQNIAPGFGLMNVPKKLQGNVKDIAVGATFSVGVSEDSEAYVWGQTQVTKRVDLAEDIPEKMGEIVQVSAGYDHIMVLNSKGQVFCWGNDRMQQCQVPSKLQSGRTKVVYIEAGYQASIAIDEDGEIYFWGNESMIDFKAGEYQGNLEKAKFTFSGVVGLTKDKEMVILGRKKASYSDIPELGEVVDFACTANTVCAITADGGITVWGYYERDLEKVPEDMDGTPIQVEAGRYHYTVLTDTGHVYSWGYDNYGQASAPSGLSGAESVHCGYFQNYAVLKDGTVKTWGLKGYLFGSDGYGRDVFSRLAGGGRMTMTIGAIAVIISTVIGVVMGSIAGFFGGKIDILIMRIQEIVSSIPFMPLAMILSAVISSSVSETGRIFMIMCILGVLQWTGLCRLVRAQVLAEREKEYVTAGRAMGVSKKALIFKHIFPNVISVIIVNATLDFAACMLTESGLSYLGFGVIEPTPTWGNMLNGCNDSVIIQNYWWRWVFPALFLGACTICINIIGDGLRDAMDPKTEQR